MKPVLFGLILALAIPGVYASEHVWSQLGPDGGDVAVLAINPQNPVNVYAATNNGRLFKSTNGGDTWMAAESGSGLGTLPIVAIAINPQHPDIVFAASLIGLYRTTNAGAVWTAVLPPYNNIQTVAVDPSAPDTIYAGSYSSGLFKSTNGGNTWSSVNNGLVSSNINTVAVHPQDSRIVYAGLRGTGAGVYRSDDAGANWTALGVQIEIASINIDPLNPAIVYAMKSGYSQTGSGIFKSTDGGDSWVELPNPQGSLLIPRALALDPQKSGTIYAGSFNGVFVSRDGGATWTATLPALSVRALCINPQNPALVFAGTPKGVYRSVGSGVTWIRSVTGMNAQMISTVALHPATPGTLYAGTMNELYRSTNGGKDWTDITPLGNIGAEFLAFDPQTPSVIYAAAGPLFKSTNGGTNWQVISTPAPITSMAIDPQTTSILYAGSTNTDPLRAIFKSTDGGGTWVSSGEGIPAPTGDGIISYFSVRKILINPQNLSVLYAGVYGSGVYKSTNGGARWTGVNRGLSNSSIYGLVMNPKNPSILYVGNSEGVFKSVDGGANWRSVNTGLTGAMISSLEMNPQDPDTLYAGSFSRGLFRTVNGGVTWAQMAGGLSSWTIRDVAVDPAANKIYAATMNGGVWVRSEFGSSLVLTLNAGGAAAVSTDPGDRLRTGYATVNTNSGAAPYGTAVLSYRQNGVVVSEVGIPATRPTTAARIFVDYGTGVTAVPGRIGSGTVDVTTGIALANGNSEDAGLTYTLRDSSGKPLATGHGTVPAGSHLACFIEQLKDIAAPDFDLPADFQTAVRFGTLEVSSDQPISILALRGTVNQRSEFLMTATPVSDLAQSAASGVIYFPQFVDGGEYTTSLVLLNTSGSYETGTLQIRDKNGERLVVNQAGGRADSSFRYGIPPNGFFRFQTEGSSADMKSGSVRVAPDIGSAAPAGSGIFGFQPTDVLVSESGIPAVVATTHARIYVDLSGNHNTGLAIANAGTSPSSITVQAFLTDGATTAGSAGQISLARRGADAQFADQLVSGLTAGFTGVLDISSDVPFAALTLRSLMNERNEFLMTAFPVADANQPASPASVFPHMADGEGYTTEFILLSPGGESGATLHLYDEFGLPIAIDD